jgi:hypothetical protein|tara:strand:+ start:2102 stop:2410 length:309 start_codon:yes stop_codon:yes gene_type:complete
LEGSKYKIGQLVTCYYKSIPPTPQWNPFIEGRPSVITGIKISAGPEKARYFYELTIVTWAGSMEKRLVGEENLVLYETLGELDREIEDLLIKYYKNNPLASD